MPTATSTHRVARRWTFACGCGCTWRHVVATPDGEPAPERRCLSCRRPVRGAL